MESSLENDSDALLSLVKGHVREYFDSTITARTLAEKCRDYKDGKQWTDAEKQKLNKRRQPCITDNKIQDKVDTLIGIEKKLRTDPMAYPRTPQDEGAAEAATDALRYVADQSDYHRTVRKPAAYNLIIEGLCAGHVVVEKSKRKGVPKVCIEHIRWDRVYYDVHSQRDDFADATYKGFFVWDDAKAWQLKYPKKKGLLEAAISSESFDSANSSANDKPRYVITQNGRARIQVFTHYFMNDGVWFVSVWCSGGWLEEPKACTYKNEDGEPVSPMELQALYRDSEGAPYGAVARYLDLQDEHNKRRSKMLHLLNSKRIVVQSGLLQNVNKVRDEVHKPDGVVEVDGDITQFRVEDNLSEAQGQWQLLQQTDQALSQTGPNAALSGLSGSISGRAKQLDQQSGALSVDPIFDALEGWEVRLYRQAWMRVRQFWTQETWVRVTDDANKIKFVPLNQPVTNGDKVAEMLKGHPMPDDAKAEILSTVAADPMAQQPAMRPDGTLEKRNDVALMDVDIIIDRSPDVVTIQQEQFGILSEVAKGRPEVPFSVLIEASALRSETKRKILDLLNGGDNPQAAQQAQAQQQAQQEAMELERAQRMANIKKTDSETEKNHATAAEIQSNIVHAGVNTAAMVAEHMPAMPGILPQQ